MNDKEIIKVNSNIYNLIAIGAFLWFFVKSLMYLISMSYNSIGIIGGMEPVVLFWTNQILNIALICIILRLWITKIWKQIDLNSINIKKLLSKIGIVIILIQILQFLHGFYVTDYLSKNYTHQLTKYYDVVHEIDRFYLIDTSFSIIGTLILLLLFIKWK